jgi:predicted ATPase
MPKFPPPPRTPQNRSLFSASLAVRNCPSAVTISTDRSWREAELQRLKGELLLALSADNHAEAEACFSQAISIARRQQARSLELRAAMNLSHLWQHQGKRAETHQILTEVYSWFTEGLDTVDLQEARTLLEAL